MDQGSKKKFLYAGPKSKETENDKWQFIPRSGTPPFQKPAIDLDSVWSIKRNVVVGNSQHDRLTLNANKNYYSRHGGIKDNTSMSVSQNSGSSTSNYPAWNNRKGFSYTDYSKSNSDVNLKVSWSGNQGYGGKSSRTEDPNDF